MPGDFPPWNLLTFLLSSLPSPPPWPALHLLQLFTFLCPQPFPRPTQSSGPLCSQPPLSPRGASPTTIPRDWGTSEQPLGLGPGPVGIVCDPGNLRRDKVGFCPFQAGSVSTDGGAPEKYEWAYWSTWPQSRQIASPP